MATECFPTRRLLGALPAAVAFALLAGCGGSQLSPQVPSQISAPDVKGHCAAHGGVRVIPCTIDLTASNPGPDNVVVRTPKGHKGTVHESDNCGGPSGVATVSQETSTGNGWTVAAGSTPGSCTAEFDFLNGKHGKKIGSAQLGITNAI